MNNKIKSPYSHSMMNSESLQARDYVRPIRMNGLLNE